MAVAYSLWKRPAWRWPDVLNPFKPRHWSWAGSLAAGIIALVWILVQFQWIQFGVLHAFIMSWSVLILIVTPLPGIRNYYTRESPALKRPG